MTRHLHLPTDLHGIDAKRIAGNSLALLVHALALALLMLPSSWEPPRSAPREETVLVEYVPPRDPPIPLPPTLLPTVEPRVTRTPVTTPQATPAPAIDTAPVMNEGTVYAEPADEGQPVDSFDAGPPDTGPPDAGPPDSGDVTDSGG